MIKEKLKTFDVVQEMTLLEKDGLETPLSDEDQNRLQDLREYAHTHMINTLVFGLYDRVHNGASLLPYFDEIDVENMTYLTDQLCYLHLESKTLIYEELRQAAVAIIVEKGKKSGNEFQVEESIVTLCANQLISEAIRLSDYDTFKKEK